ncbi:MAG TPA: hypothetical protein VN648_31240 [Candidatus Methylomirabilis sp.]|nr:hypothetical protein [Candidatus Methylomirabilis sp.]
MDIMGSMHNVCNIVVGNQYIKIILRLSWIHQRGAREPHQKSVLECSKAHAPNLLRICDIVFAQFLDLLCPLELRACPFIILNAIFDHAYVG